LAIPGPDDRIFSGFTLDGKPFPLTFARITDKYGCTYEGCFDKNFDLTGYGIITGTDLVEYVEYQRGKYNGMALSEIKGYDDVFGIRKEDRIVERIVVIGKKYLGNDKNIKIMEELNEIQFEQRK
jgi:hypothetical protein